MNKTELVNAVAEKAEISKKDADKAVAAVIDAVIDALKEGDKVIFSKYAGVEIKFEEETYIVIRQNDIFAIIEQ